MNNMSTPNITTQIYNRHLAGLRRVTAEGTWIDEAAVNLALWLALTEQAERLPNAPQGENARNLWLLGEWLQENLEAEPAAQLADPAEWAKDAIRELQDRLNAETGANIVLIGHHETLKRQVADLERDQVAALGEANLLRTQLEEQVGALVAAQTEAGMLRQQRADQGERIHALETEISTLRAALAELQQSERSAVNHVQELRAALEAQRAAPVALAGPNGHSVPTPDFLAPKADLPEGLSPAAEDAWRSCQQGVSFRRLPLAIRLELVQAVLRQGEPGKPMKMSKYEAVKPAWMPLASGLPKVFGVSWLDLADLTPDRIKEAA